MKVLCIKQTNPDDDCGHSNELSIVITEKHVWYVDLYDDWETGKSIESDDWEVAKEEVYDWTFNKLADFFADKGNVFDGWLYESEYHIEGCVLEMSEEELNNIKLIKDSNLTAFVDNNAIDCYDVSYEIMLYIVYLTYIGYGKVSYYCDMDIQDMDKTALKAEIEKQMKNA